VPHSLPFQEVEILSVLDGCRSCRQGVQSDLESERLKSIFQPEANANQWWDSTMTTLRTLEEVQCLLQCVIMQENCAVWLRLGWKRKERQTTGGDLAVSGKILPNWQKKSL